MGNRREVKYYVASATVAKLCEEMYADEKRARVEAANLSKELGFNPDHVACRRDVLDGRFKLAGFIAREGQKVDAKLYKKLEIVNGVAYAPRLSSKAGKALEKRMNSIKDVGLSKIMDAIGHEAWGPDCSVQTPGVAKYGDKWYLVVPARTTPKLLRRISDVAYEAAAKADKEGKNKKAAPKKSKK